MIISQAGKSNNVIWNRIITEWAEFVNSEIAYDYNDIIDVVKPLDYLDAIPDDNQKYYIRYDADSNELNTIYSFDGISYTYEYKPVYKDRIIFTDGETVNYIFQDLNIHQGKQPIIKQREQCEKYNNTMIGDFGITLFESGFDKNNLNQQPCINFMVINENGIPLWDRRNQPKSLNKSITYNFMITTTNTDLFNDKTPYTALEDMELIVKYMWGEYLDNCASAYKSRIDNIVYNGEMINEVTHRPSIIYNMEITLNFI